MAGRTEGNGLGSDNGTSAVSPVTGDEGEVAEQLTALRAETHEILELVRSLVALLLPKGSDDGPKLEDLIAALVAQQRDILVATRQIQADMLVLLERSGGVKSKPTSVPGPSNGSARG